MTDLVPNGQSKDEQFASRREFHLAQSRLPRRERATLTVRPVAEPPAHTGIFTRSSGSSSQKKKSSTLNLAIMTLIVPGLFCTIALPAYAYDSNTPDKKQLASAALVEMKDAGAQSIVVSDSAPDPVKRDAYSATTVAQLQQAKLEAVRVQREAERARIRATFKYAGPSAADLLAGAQPSSLDLAAVLNFALSFQGVRYQYGGESPAGFDCSGLTLYVLAKFGIKLPHSAAAQGRMGTKISRADARPGDLVAMNDGSHIGFYMGGNNILDAPQAGGVVSVRPIWTSAVHFVRFG